MYEMIGTVLLTIVLLDMIGFALGHWLCGSQSTRFIEWVSDNPLGTYAIFFLLALWPLVALGNFMRLLFTVESE